MRKLAKWSFCGFQEWLQKIMGKERIVFSSVLRELSNFLSFLAVVITQWNDPSDQEKQTRDPTALDKAAITFLLMDGLSLFIYFSSWLMQKLNPTPEDRDVDREARFREKTRIALEKAKDEQNNASFSPTTSTTLLTPSPTPFKYRLSFFRKINWSLDLLDDIITDFPILCTTIAYMVLREHDAISAVVAAMSALKIITHLWAWMMVDVELFGYVFVRSEDDYDAN